MGLIDYRWRILCYADHLTGFAHVAYLENKNSTILGRAVVRILLTAVLSKILRSDNGGEFFGKCIAYLKPYFRTIHIVKGRAKKPTTQGSVERGDGPFNIALEKWIKEHLNDSWAAINAYL